MENKYNQGNRLNESYNPLQDADWRLDCDASEFDRRNRLPKRVGREGEELMRPGTLYVPEDVPSI